MPVPTTSDRPRRLHLFHRWSRWHDAEGVFDAPLLPKLGTWSAVVQVRWCEQCGKKKVHRVS